MLRFCCSSASLRPLQTPTNLHCPPLPLSTYSVVTYSKQYFSARQFGNKIVHNHTPCGRDRHAVNAVVIASCGMQTYYSYTIRYEDCFSILYIILTVPSYAHIEYQSKKRLKKGSVAEAHPHCTKAYLHCTLYCTHLRYAAKHYSTVIIIIGRWSHIWPARRRLLFPSI